MDKERTKAWLADYPLECRGIEAHGSLCRVWTDRGSKRLRRSTGGEESFRLMNRMLEGLASRGMRRISRPILDRYGRPWRRESDNIYYLVDWIDGEPLNFCRDEDVILAAGQMGEMHRLSVGLLSEARDMPWSDRFCRLLKEMALFRDEAEGEEGFGFLFREGVDSWLKEGRQALDELPPLGKGEPKVFCHRRWRESNLLRKSSGALWVLDFDKGGPDHPAYDLGRFIRLVMARRQWLSPDILPSILQAYRGARPDFGREEEQFLLAYLRFPRKPWLLAARYYGGGGRWASELLIRELNQYRREEEGRREVVQIVRMDLASQA